MTLFSRLSSLLVAVPAMLLSGGCATTLHARVYNLDTAEIIQAEFFYNYSGKGPAKMILPSGVICEGEYSTGGSTDRGRQQEGTAVATCPGGLIFDCEYVTGASMPVRGSGTCTDNRSGKYRLVF